MFEIFYELLNAKIVLLSVLVYISYKLTFWKRQGIRNKIFHIINLFRYPIHVADQKLIQKYGPVVGTYELLTPSILIAEPDLIKRIFNTNIKDFFDHRTYIFPEKTGGESLLFLKYNSWKIKRAIISPAFKTKNLKGMFLMFDKAVNSLILNMEDNIDVTIDIKPYFETFMFDVILRAFFGTQIDSVCYTNNPLIKNFDKILGIDFSLKQIIGIMSPKLAKLFDIEMVDKNAIQFLADLSAKIINERKNLENKKDDCIQYLIDTEIEFPDENIKKSLTTKEIIDNCILFLIAGIDTSNNTLSHLIYALVNNPDIQEKLHKQINQFCDNQEITFELIKKISYLDACLKETLRLWPPGSRFERICDDDIQFGNIFIPKDSIVIIPVYAVHRDPNNFENPNDFTPERFLPENIHLIKSGTYIPFGDGPRICVANRFAELALKLCAVKIIRKFKFLQCSKTDPIAYYMGQPFMTIKEMQIQLIKR